jgi:hypothetical protein
VITSLSRFTPLAVTICLAFAGSAAAKNTQSFADLVFACQSGERLDQPGQPRGEHLMNSMSAIECMAFIEGVLQTNQLFTEKRGAHPYYCLPTNYTNYEIELVALKFAHEHPETLHLQTASVLTTALSQEFPCGR